VPLYCDVAIHYQIEKRALYSMVDLSCVWPA
jgi:hypothetical protein